MEAEFGVDATLTAREQELDSPVVEAASTEYLGQWNRLVSTTNWEKGRIICEWREALLKAGAAAGSATDEAWSQRVGNVTPQHVGRLRRVFQRFGHVREQYSGLYWSHFQSALDWPDAEMWLEGAVQNQWSISQMQHERTRTLSMVDGSAAANEAGALEMDEDAPPAAGADMPQAISPSQAEVRDTGEFEEAADADDQYDDQQPPFEAENANSFADQSPVAAVRPFGNLPTLPQDLGDAFEAFKLAIIHHRLAGWQEVSCEDALAALDALRQLAVAPS